MLNKSAIAIICVSLFCGIFVTESELFAQAAQKKEYKARIVWQEVPGAGGYMIEIRNMKGVVLFTKETEKSEVFPRLPLGDYQMKITVLDKFKRQANSTPWTKISVTYYETPMFERVEPAQFVIGAKSEEIVIRGDNFNEKIDVKVEGPGSVTVSNVRRISEEEIRATIDFSSAADGKYSIILANPAEKKTSASNVLSLSSPVVQKVDKKIEISSVSPSKIVIPGTVVEMTLNGVGFERGARIFIKQDGKEYDSSSEVRNDKEVVAKIPINTLEIGTCEIVLKQNGREIIYKNVPVAEKNDGLLGLNGLFFGAGYVVNFLQPEWQTYYKNSYKGFCLYAAHPMFNLFTSKGVASIGWEADVLYNKYERKPELNKWDSTLTVIHGRAGLYVSNDFRVPINIILRADGGALYTTLTQTSGSSSQKTSSLDFSVSFGSSVRYIIMKSSFIECGADFENVFYKGAAMKKMRATVRAGAIL
jgi:hypothetical protein